jgi:hypothetical protein
MKNVRSKDRDKSRVAVAEILPEYDFSRARRNKFAPRFAAGSVVALPQAAWL